jgi:catechol 2,3-dioxygenase-like lactoylglutathione lyase family enzyme
MMGSSAAADGQASASAFGFAGGTADELIGTGIPGLSGLDHVGLTVPDLDQATRFLVDVLGCEYLYSLGPMRDEGDWMKRHLNVDPRAVVTELRFFRCGSSPIFEVFEYSAPGRVSEPPRNSDIGGHHFALYVADIDAAVAYLREHDVEVLGEPTASVGAHEGQRWVYFMAPWGAQFELVSYPEGRAWYRERGIDETVPR